MGDSESELLLILKAKDLASSKVDGLGKSIDKTGGKAKRGGINLGLLAKGAGVAAIGIGALVFGLAKATGAAAEEQKGIARMNAAIKSNDKAFHGNTDAIEALISKREGLAFSDDQLRDSLTFLVTKYHDVNRAQALQATAMDLARLKGISLQDATVLLSKGLDGSSKVLKQLGIDLPKTATEQERLTAIQKAAAGQAEAYGKTAAGAQEAFQIAMDDLVEDAGSLFLPIMKDVFGFLRETVIPAIRTVAKRIGDWMSKNKPLISQIKTFVGGVLKTLWQTLSTVVDWISRVIGTITSNKDAMNVLRFIFAGIAGAAKLVWQALQKVFGWLGDVWKTVSTNKFVLAAVRIAFQLIKNTVDKVVGALKGLVKWAQKAVDWLANIIDLIPDIKIPNLPFSVGAPAIQGASSPGFSVQTTGTVAASRPVEIPVVIDGKEVARIVDRRLYANLRRAAPTASGA